MLAPPHHRLVLTDDGSYTLHSERFDESCHSTSGAREETRTHYLAGCALPKLFAQHATVAVLEVGFGAGLGWRETLALALQYPNSRLQFYSLELDHELAQWSLPTATLHEKDDRRWLEYQQDNASLTVILGDARQTLPLWKNHFPKFQAIYQDAFSPRKNPTLWTKEWFALIGELSHPSALLATYSASISIRKALHAAGWGVSKGPAFARKKSSTRAEWLGASDSELIAELMLHPTPALTDQGIL